MPTNMPSQHARHSSPTSVSLSAHLQHLEAEAQRVSGCIVIQVPLTSCSHLPVTRKMFQRVVSHPLACCFRASTCTQSQTSMSLMFKRPSKFLILSNRMRHADWVMGLFGNPL